MQTIPQQFATTVQTFPNRPAVRFKFHGAYSSVTFSQLQQRVEDMAKGLRALGVTAGDRVAILSENRSEWIRSDLAILWLGAVTVPIHTTLSPSLIEHVINDCQATTVIVSNQTHFAKLAAIHQNLSSVTTIIYITLDHPEEYTLRQRLVSLADVMEQGAAQPESLAPVVGSPDDIATIMYTSGTTGMPKGVMLTHRNFLSNAQAATTVLSVTEHDTYLSFLPFSHVLERTAAYYAGMVYRGSCLALAEDIKALSRNLKEVKPTIFVAVPRVFEKFHATIWEHIKDGGALSRSLFVWALRQNPGTFGYWFAHNIIMRRVRGAFGGRLRFAISGGATLNPKLGKFFERIGIAIIEGYGLSETAPVATVNRLGAARFGTVGTQLPGVEVMLTAEKEIIVRGPNVMKGYYNKPELTQQVIDADGWFHTGDLGHFDGDGYLTIIGRKKEMMVLSNGKNVWPEQLELLLNNDRCIAQSVVYGHQRPHLVALIVPDWQEVGRVLADQGVTLGEPDVMVKHPAVQALFNERIHKLNQQIADWEDIRRFVLLPREFSQQRDELTPTLKLRRSVIEQRYRQLLDGLYR